MRNVITFETFNVPTELQCHAVHAVNTGGV